MPVLPLLLTCLLGAEQVIDDFRYSDTQAARRAWRAGERTPPVEIAEDGGAPVLQVTAPFATKRDLLRTVIDRRVALDLLAADEFTLQVAADAPEAVEHWTLYFRSGDGWYAADGWLRRKGWQTLHFSKASFRAEDTPAGWHKIDGVRIAAWRGRAVDAKLRIRRLATHRHDVALVIPGRAIRPDDNETATAMETANRLAAMLAELGLGSDAVDEAAVAKGALGDRRVAVLAYNPRLANRTAAALEQFVTNGGKLLICYQLPDRLGRVLGFNNPKYFLQQQPGDFAEIRFDAAGVPGVPKSVRQASWNITTAEPAGYNARVIGRWYNASGKATGHAAMLLSDRGAFFSHIFLRDDPAGKRQLLAAVLGRLAPPLWTQMTQAALERAERVGHCSNASQLEAQVNSGGSATTRRQLDSAMTVLTAAKRRAGDGDHPGSVVLARKAHDLLADAYLRAQPSPRREGRAVWNHSGTGAYAGDWDRSAAELAAAGFNMVLPNMLWGGRAHYASDVLPRSATFRRYGDQVEQCVRAAKKHGLEVHVWKVNYNLSGAPADFVETIRRKGRLQMTAAGQPHPWLCPSHPENQKLEVESMLEVARKYPVAGLHFDYIRYPGRESCYCAGCRERFEADSGQKVANWPGDCYSGSRRKEYNDWRCRQITTVVAALHREGKRLRPELKISAAVFGSYPACRESVAQDWPKWVEAGYLDFVCPMDYTNSDLGFTNLVENQVRLVGGRIPVYPGIGATASNSTLSPDRVVGQIHHARRLGAAGFTIFDFHRQTAATIIPGVGLGAGAQSAVAPHNAR